MSHLTKKRQCMVGFAFFVFSFALLSSFTSQNSLPAHAWGTGYLTTPGEKAYHLFAPSTNDLSVTSESLNFDLAAYDGSAFDDTNGMPFQFTSTYQLHNAGDAQSVTLGFPMVTSFQNFPTKTIEIHQGSDPVDFNAVYGKKTTAETDYIDTTYVNPETFENLTLAQGLEQTLSEESQLAGDLMAKVYRFDLDGVTQEKAVVRFVADPYLTRLVLDRPMDLVEQDLNPGNYREYLVSIDVPTLGPSYDLTFTVVGEDISDIEAFGANESLTVLTGYDETQVIETTVMPLQNKVNEMSSLYLSNYETRIEFNEVTGVSEITTFPLDPTQALHLLEYETFQALDNAFYTDFPALMLEAWCQDRILFIVFDVDMPSGGNQTLTLDYSYFTGVDGYYDPIVWYIHFVSNPGKQWSSVGPLSVMVSSPESFVIQTSLTFDKQEDGSYVASLDAFPEENFSFGICDSENPTNFQQDFMNFMQNLVDTSMFIIVYILSPGAVVTGITLAIVFGLKAKKKRQKAQTTQSNERKSN